MACPHVSGVAALLLSNSASSVTVRNVVEAMEQSAQDRGSQGRDDRYGHGIVQAVDAMRYLLGTPPVPSPTNPPVTSPTNPPVPSPTVSPVSAPVSSPVASPAIAPFSEPFDSPIGSPVSSPVDFGRAVL